tara:strand:+ start:9288 stop:9683 length:396 start_codon:yes stop_codon:yes gene_type:complete
MTPDSERGWTLHYTIGSVLAAKVKTGDLVQMPGGQDNLIVLGGRAPLRVKDPGSVIVRKPAADAVDGFEVRPGAVGMVWISAAGGWSELPESPPRYCADAVQQQIERDRRRSRISRKEERLIHALLKGRGN